MWMCTTILIIPCVFLRYVSLKEHTRHPTDVEGQPFSLSTLVCPHSVVAVVIATVCVEWRPAALVPLRAPFPPPHESGKMFKPSDHFFRFRWEMRERIQSKVHTFWANLNPERGGPWQLWLHDGVDFIHIISFTLLGSFTSGIVSVLLRGEIQEHRGMDTVKSNMALGSVLATLARCQGLWGSSLRLLLSLHPA